MAGTSGNNALLAFSKQSTKGTAAASIQFVTKFTGGDLDFARDMGRLDETNGSRDVGASYVQSVTVKGSPSMYLRTVDAVHALEGVLGSRSTSGAGPYTHTLTPSDTTVPYYTFWQSLGGAVTSAPTLSNRFVDCVWDSVKFTGGTGQPLEAQASILGLSGTRITASYPGTPTTETPLLYSQVAVTKGGVAKTSVNSFELEIANNHVLQQGNGSISAYDVAPGERRVTGSMTMLFESVADYANFHTNSPSGTTPSATVLTEALDITVTVSANQYITFTLPSVAYTSYKVTPDKAGGPIIANISFEGEPNGSPILTAVVKNSTSGTSYNGV